MSPDVVLASTRDLPVPDLETNELCETLRRAGATCEVWSWEDPRHDWEAAERVVLRSTWDYVDRLEEFLLWCRGLGARLMNPPSVVKWNSHKRYLFDLGSAGVTIPRTLLLPASSSAEVAAALLQEASRWGTEVVVKRSVGSGARGAVLGVPGEAGFDEAVGDANSGRDLLLQEFLPEISTNGEVSLIAIDGEVRYSLKKVPSSGDYRVQPHYGGAFSRHEPDDRELMACESVLRWLSTNFDGPLLYARVDLVSTSSAVVLMEAELIEPDLYMSYEPGAFEIFACAIMQRLGFETD